jgi:hypothetical protein
VVFSIAGFDIGLSSRISEYPAGWPYSESRVVSVRSSVSTMKTARSCTGSLVLAFSPILWRAPGSSN